MRKVFPLLICFLIVSCGGNKYESVNQVENQIRNILLLPTYEHVYREIIYIGEEKKILGITTRNKEILFSIDISVTAGLDLNDQFRISINPDKRAVEVTIPPARILKVDAQEETIHQFFAEQDRDQVDHLDYYDEIASSKEDIIADAYDKDILRKAQNNARNIIQSMLLSAGFTNIEFTYTENNRNQEQNTPEQRETDGGDE